MIEKKHSVATAYVHPATIFQQFSECLLNMVIYEMNNGKGRLHSNISASHAYIPQARNHVVELFLGTDAEWLLFFDYDMVFNPDFLEQLANVADSKERRIVAGLYFNYLGDDRIHPTWLRKNEKNGELTTLSAIPPNSLIEIDSVGMGGTLIHRSVFEEMMEAYKDDPWRWYAHDLAIENGKPIRMGEDTTFCTRAGKLGIKIWGYSGAQMGHIKSKVLTLETALEEQKKDRKNIYGSAYYDSLTKLAEKFKPKYGLEIGTEFGVSADAFLSGSGGLKLVTIDPQNLGLEDIKMKYGDRMIFIQGFTPEVFGSIRHRQFDWIYIDGDHEYEAVKKDIENSWPLLEPSGVMIFDDYGIERYRVNQAVDEFVAANHLELHPVEKSPHGAVYVQKV